MNDFEYYLEQSANDAKSFLNKSETESKSKEMLNDLKSKIEKLENHMENFNKDDTAFWDDSLEMLGLANEHIDDLLIYFDKDYSN